MIDVNTPYARALETAKAFVTVNVPEEFWQSASTEKIVGDMAACLLALNFLAMASKELGARPVAKKGKVQ